MSSKSNSILAKMQYNLRNEMIFVISYLISFPFIFYAYYRELHESGTFGNVLVTFMCKLSLLPKQKQCKQKKKKQSCQNPSK